MDKLRSKVQNSLGSSSTTLAESQSKIFVFIARDIFEMYSLYDALLTQHSRQLTPVRCAHSTIAQLHRYFEDVVLENNLRALVIESLPLSAKRTNREQARFRELARGGQRAFFFVRQADALNARQRRQGVLQELDGK